MHGHLCVCNIVAKKRKAYKMRGRVCVRGQGRVCVRVVKCVCACMVVCVRVRAWSCVGSCVCVCMYVRDFGALATWSMTIDINFSRDLIFVTICCRSLLRMC